jgi:hypothetical protein
MSIRAMMIGGAGATRPDPPTGVSAGSATTSSLSVSFSAPANNGGSAITQYTVTSSPGGVTATGSSSPITVSGLTAGTSYTFTVTATNAIGTSNASSASSAVSTSSPQPPVGWFTWTGGRGSGDLRFISADTSVSASQNLSGTYGTSSLAWDPATYTLRSFSGGNTGYKWVWTPSTKTWSSSQSFSWGGAGFTGYNSGSGWAYNGYFGWIQGNDGDGTGGTFYIASEGGSASAALSNLTGAGGSWAEESLGQAGPYMYATGYYYSAFFRVTSGGACTKLAVFSSGLQGALMVSCLSDRAKGAGAMTQSAGTVFFDHATQTLTSGTSIGSRNGAMSSMYGGQMAYVDWPIATAGSNFSSSNYNASLVSVTNTINYTNGGFKHSKKNGGSQVPKNFFEGGFCHDPVSDSIYAAGADAGNVSTYVIYKYNKSTDEWDFVRNADSAYFDNRGRGRTIGSAFTSI